MGASAKGDSVLAAISKTVIQGLSKGRWSDNGHWRKYFTFK